MPVAKVMFVDGTRVVKSKRVTWGWKIILFLAAILFIVWVVEPTWFVLPPWIHNYQVTM